MSAIGGKADIGEQKLARPIAYQGWGYVRRSSHFCPISGSPSYPRGASMSGGSTMGPHIPTLPEISRFVWNARAKRKETAKKLPTDSVMTRDELIKLCLLSDKDMN
jgi:hypothetical protein